MKHKTTAKAIRENYGKNYRLEVGYCDAQFLLRYDNPTGYASGVYGWNFDLYEIDGIAICTGYRGMPSGKNYDYAILRKYDNMARAIIEARKPENMAWDKFLNKQKKQVKNLQKKFFKEVYTK